LYPGEDQPGAAIAVVLQMLTQEADQRRGDRDVTPFPGCPSLELPVVVALAVQRSGLRFGPAPLGFTDDTDPTTRVEVRDAFKRQLPPE
jgi:hypothetical protein